MTDAQRVRDLIRTAKLDDEVRDWSFDFSFKVYQPDYPLPASRVVTNENDVATHVEVNTSFLYQSAVNNGADPETADKIIQLIDPNWRRNQRMFV